MKNGPQTAYVLDMNIESVMTDPSCGSERVFGCRALYYGSIASRLEEVRPRQAGNKMERNGTVT